MKVLTLIEPWATLVVYEQKWFETRSWTTAHRGPLLIHAAKTMDRRARNIVRMEPFTTVLCEIFGTGNADEALSIIDKQRGCILGVVDVEKMHKTEEIRHTLTPRELNFGDYSMGRFAWQLNHALPFMVPIKARGALGLWNTSDETLRLMREYGHGQLLASVGEMI